MLPGSTVHDPVNQVISSEELRSLVACLSTVLSELESRVLSLYLDGYSYTTIGERLGCDCKTVDNALQRVKRKVGAHLASRAVPALRPCPSGSSSCSPSCWCWPSAATSPASASSSAPDPRSSAGSRRSSATSPPPRRWTAAGTASTSRPPRAGSPTERLGHEPEELTLVEVIDKPGTDDDQAVFLVDGRRTPHPWSP